MNKILKTTIIEIVFTIILILLLVLIRHQSLQDLNEIQSVAQGVSELQNIDANNLSLEQRQQLESTVDSLDSKLNKALFLVKLLLPISIIILSLIFYYLIWRILTKIGIKKFVSYSIIPIILLLTTAFLTLNYIAYSFYFVENNPFIFLIISKILLIITYYLFLFLATINKSFKKTIKIAYQNIHKILIPFILNLITNIVYFALIFTLFFLAYAKASILIPSIAMLILLILINIQRTHLVKKISKLR